MTNLVRFITSAGSANAHAGFSHHMAATRQRKRMVLCSRCHNDVHAGQPTDRQRRTARSRGEPNALKGTFGSEGA